MGYLHVKDVLELEDANRAVPQQIWRPMATVRAELPLDDALTVMRRAATHLAQVADGSGRVLGLVAMEDVLETLVGRYATRPTGWCPCPAAPWTYRRRRSSRRPGPSCTDERPRPRRANAPAWPSHRARLLLAPAHRTASRQHLAVGLHQVRETQRRQVLPGQLARVAGEPQVAVGAALLVQRPQETAVAQLVDPPWSTT